MEQGVSMTFDLVKSVAKEAAVALMKGTLVFKRSVYADRRKEIDDLGTEVGQGLGTPWPASTRKGR